jgi:c(7)-type cytochrome triheme protein
MALALFALAARYLNIFPMAKPCLDDGQTCKDRPVCCLVMPAKVWSVCVWTIALTLLVVATQQYRAFRPDVVSQPTNFTAPATSWPGLPSDLTLTTGTPGVVTFSHRSHVESASCMDCHRGAVSILGRRAEATRESGALHAADRCGACHDTQAPDACAGCHQPSSRP